MPRDAPKRRVKSAENVVDITEFIRDQDGATPKELADHLGLATSTVYEYMSTLEYKGFVTKEDEEYQLSFRFLTYGGYVRDNEPLYNVSRKWIRELSEEIDELIAMSVEENGKRIAILVENDRYNLRNRHPLGKEFNLHTSAAGKAILAELNDARIRDIIDDHGLTEQTENTIVEEEALFKEIDTIRDRGYALNLEERREGWHAVASGITHPVSNTVGTISIAGPTNRLPQDELENEYADAILQVINEIEIEIQFTEK